MTDTTSTRTNKRLSEEEIRQILTLWLGKAGTVREIARAVGRKPSTVYAVLQRSGLWTGIDNPDAIEDGIKIKSITRHSGKGGGYEIKLSRPRKPKLKQEFVAQGKPLGEITMIEPPKRSLWQRIKGWLF